MKKITSLMLATILIMALAGCVPFVNINNTSENNKQPNQSGSQESASPEKGAQDWETFLAEYENWVKDYKLALEELAANPLNVGLINEVASMTAQVPEWAAKAVEVATSVPDSAIAAFNDKIAQLSAEIAEAMPTQ